jgi:hypothetical protein
VSPTLKYVNKLFAFLLFDFFSNVSILENGDDNQTAICTMSTVTIVTIGH